MLPAHAIEDHAPLLALIAEHLQSEAEALEAAEGELERLLYAGGVLALSRVAADEAARLMAALLAHSPARDGAKLRPKRRRRPWRAPRLSPAGPR